MDTDTETHGTGLSLQLRYANENKILTQYGLSPRPLPVSAYGGSIVEVITIKKTLIRIKITNHLKGMIV